jgi:von Willebrand factor A domain-containing protein 7
MRRNQTGAILAIALAGLFGARAYAFSDDLQTILSVRGPLTEVARTVTFPVDASVSRLLIATELCPGATVTLFRPNDVQVQPTDPDVKLWSVGPPKSGRVSRALEVIVSAPHPGEWRVDVSGGSTAACSNFSVVVRGRSRISFDEFDFVAIEDDPGEGRHYFPIEGMPVAGEPALGRARVTAELPNLVFRIVDEAGSVIETLALEHDKRAPAEDLIGPVRLPRGPFRLVFSGIDASGATVQRQFPTVFRAQPLAVTFEYDDALLPVLAGSSRQFRFRVRNAGASRETFALQVAATRGVVRRVAPRSLTIDAGATGTATFSLRLPASATPGDLIDVRITVTNTAHAAESNGVSVRLNVAYPNDVDGDGIPNAEDNCPNVPNGDQLDMNKNGIGDACEGIRAKPRPRQHVIKRPAS